MTISAVQNDQPGGGRDLRPGLPSTQPGTGTTAWYTWSTTRYRNLQPLQPVQPGTGTNGLVYLTHNKVQEPMAWSTWSTCTIRYRNLRSGLPGIPQSGTGTYGLVYLYKQGQEPTAWSTWSTTRHRNLQPGLPSQQPGTGNYSLVYLVYLYNQVQEP